LFLIGDITTAGNLAGWLELPMAACGCSTPYRTALKSREKNEWMAEVSDP
jgi:hypothetical protein